MTLLVTSNNPINQVTAPALPLAAEVYNRSYQDQLNNVLRLYFNRLDGILAQLMAIDITSGLVLPYGAFHDTTTQTQSATGTAKAMTFNSTDLSNTISIGTPTSRVVVATAGIYNFQFSVQLDKASGAAGHTYIWPRINGVDVPASASEVAIQGTTAENIPSWNFVLEMAANDYFELMWSVDDTNIQLKAVAAAAPVPAIPSVILTATFVSAAI